MKKVKVKIYSNRISLNCPKLTLISEALISEDWEQTIEIIGAVGVHTYNMPACLSLILLVQQLLGKGRMDMSSITIIIFDLEEDCVVRFLPLVFLHFLCPLIQTRKPFPR